MTISIWRYSHLALAVSSFLFLALASVTGIILAFEPVSEKIQPYRTPGFETISVADFIVTLKKTDVEIIDFTVDENQFVIVKAIDDNGKNTEFYTDAKTGKSLATVPEKSEFFEWITNLHRSLFMHNLGRAFMGITAFLLLLIAISGSVLIVQRQRGVKRFFSKVVKEGFAQYYHVILGRISLVLILIIAITGTYLSLVRFGFFTDPKPEHHIDFDAIQSEPKQQTSQFPIFRNTRLSDVENLEFPFSDDPEDYFTLKTTSGEFVVNQYTGEVLSRFSHSKTHLLQHLSLDLHTGRASSIWALILAFAAANILFFIYSGFAMTLKRRKSKISNKFKKEQSEYILLVGSENGSTLHFADAIHKQLLKSGKKSFIAELNDYSVYPKASHIIVMTSTYGLGDPPSNARKFGSLLAKNQQSQKILFSVVGFGSHAYLDFCRFAFELNQKLSLQPWATALTEIHTINDKSTEQFSNWARLWSEKSGTGIPVPDSIFQHPQRLHSFKVIEKSELSHPEGAFMIKFRTKKRSFTSGDLLNIYPANDNRERQYSIGKIGDDIQISVKLHPNGFGSNYLFSLKPDDIINASVAENPNFHFPKKAKKAIMISNGTGIAPFLGMISQNKNTEIHLYCGFRDRISFALYQDSIEHYQRAGKLKSVHIAYSREEKREYVRDLLSKDAENISTGLQNGDIILICGSLAMQQNVLELLQQICSQPVSFYLSNGQILMDCY